MLILTGQTLLQLTRALDRLGELDLARRKWTRWTGAACWFAGRWRAPRSCATCGNMATRKPGSTQEGSARKAASA
jgi:hypothetical protein